MVAIPINEFQAGSVYGKCYKTILRKLTFISAIHPFDSLYKDAVAEVKNNFQIAKKMVQNYGDDESIEELQEIGKCCEALGINLEGETSRKGLCAALS